MPPVSFTVSSTCETSLFQLIDWTEHSGTVRLVTTSDMLLAIDAKGGEADRRGLRMLQAFALTRLGESDLLRLSAVHEKFSEHPFGQALVKAAQDKAQSVRDAQQFAAPARGGAARDHRGEQDASAGRAGYVDLGRCRLAPLQRTSRSVLIGLVLPRAGARRSPFRRSGVAGDVRVVRAEVYFVCPFLVGWDAVLHTRSLEPAPSRSGRKPSSNRTTQCGGRPQSWPPDRGAGRVPIAVRRRDDRRARHYDRMTLCYQHASWRLARFDHAVDGGPLRLRHHPTVHPAAIVAIPVEARATRGGRQIIVWLGVGSAEQFGCEALRHAHPQGARSLASWQPSRSWMLTAV